MLQENTALNTERCGLSANERPLAIDLFCGLGGWTDGLLADNYRVIGFDIERHEYGEHRYPGQLVIQDVTTLHGSQFRNATLIVASPPCQAYSYMAMPWKLAKAKQAAIEADTTGEKRAELNRLFDACFRIQREACEAAGRHIPMIVENVRGAQKWVGRARWNFGSFYFWGDVPALMPVAKNIVKVGGFTWSDHGKPGYKAQAFNGTAERRQVDGIKNTGGSWFNVGSPGQKVTGKNPVHELSGIKCGGDWFNADQPSISRMTSSKSPARKMASAMIAKIPEPLSRHIARTFKPFGTVAAQAIPAAVIRAHRPATAPNQQPKP